MKEGTIWVAICNKTAKLFTCNRSGKTVYWNSQKEASDKIQDSGYEVEFYMDGKNQDKLIAADQAMLYMQ